MLAALHFNENAGRKQRSNDQGVLQYSIHYPKFKQGGYVVRRVLMDPTFGMSCFILWDAKISYGVANHP